MLTTTLDRYVLRKLLGTFVPTCLALGFLFFLGATFRLLKVEELSLGQVSMTLPWLVPFLLPYLLPLAWVISVSLVYPSLASAAPSAMPDLRCSSCA